MSYLVGKIALDVTAGAPNNGLGEDNVARVKQLRVGRDVHPYVSAQAFRRWLRDSLPADEPVSPVIRSGSGQKQQAYTQGRPDLYLDDDIFGYMVAVKGDKAKTCQRDTVLATGTLVSVAPRHPDRDFGTMSRGFAAGENPVLHGHEFYSAELAGDVLLDLPRIGVFETDGTGLKVALPEPAAKEARENGAEDVSFRGASALRLGIVERRRRAALLLRTLSAVRGGAKQSMHYGDRTPALVLLAPVKGGINPFTRVFGARMGRTEFDASVLRAEIEAWADELDGQALLGWAPGFLGTQRDHVRSELADLVAAGTLAVDHPRLLLNTLAGQIERGERDSWFEDQKG
ncbi:type I-B CRISPR-associated protein Cas7/Cst2/DevR [Nonomuraea sp. FMUSA5-5]|uniref:Type I-B CRISPR-associated protein Cas7/Cst2/DevR n=1 Tax=Nonomuraea composti TaxID=2720023 RepID=A0ABX1BNW9_9ACTN|nr:type I-B CRISPR-associated protein Cas7/Cst2/DevR [Nonomuraea sp. FMUSA5-5]NJP97977.1 type I-B CRISPR-associated protein Cas7/Cst2/DevR [Nonomuraea sp. FMUSA5-5]